MTLLKIVEGALGKILFGIVLNHSGQIKIGYLCTLNGGLVMLEYREYSFEEGRDLYQTALSKKAQGDDEGARNDFNDAKSIFMMCRDNNQQAAQYLKLTEEQLKNLG